jgi:hypothetical protein
MESEVKEAAGFLFPNYEAAKENSDPYRSYLESSQKLFSSLAQAAAYNLEKLSYSFHNIL